MPSGPQTKAAYVPGDISIQVYVMSGASTTVNVGRHSSCGDFRRQACEQLGLPPRNTELVYDSKTLDHCRALRWCGIKSGASMFLVVKSSAESI